MTFSLVGRCERTGMVGTAVTCYTGPSDNLALFGALHAAKRGDVLVAAADGFTTTAIAGKSIGTSSCANGTACPDIALPRPTSAATPASASASWTPSSTNIHVGGRAVIACLP